MRWAMIAFCCLAGIAPALAESCPGNPDALGTSRTLVVDGHALPRIGTMNNPTSLPLEDKEVVLTFDDGPRPPYTEQILAALAHECVRATFFEVGYMIRANPQTTRRVYNEGHSIGSHSLNHLLSFAALGPSGIEAEVGGGFAMLSAALGDAKAVSTFFRAPGLAQNPWLNGYLKARGISLWSTDTHARDWTRISASEIISRALAQLDAKGRGILLLHDLQPATALAMPKLLRELKERGYRIVHAVPPGDQPKSVPEPDPAESPSPLIAQRGWPVAVVPQRTRISGAAANPSERALSEPGVAQGRAAAPLHALTGMVARKPASPTKGWPRKPTNPSPAAWSLLGRT